MQLPTATRRALQRHAAGKKLKPTIHHELHNLGLITDTGELTHKATTYLTQKEHTK